MKKHKIKRIVTHLLKTRRDVLACFPKAAIERVEQSIAISETKHLAELRCVIESGWDILSLYREKSPRERALEWFGQTRLWDTELNTGVLVYISFADQQIEIVADRGVVRLLPNSLWEKICTGMSQSFKKQEYTQALEAGLQAIEQELLRVLPRGELPYHNQHPNQVILI
ncbi:MAG: TPM domain-containing protein [Neisseriaceae bacterium]